MFNRTMTCNVPSPIRFKMFDVSGAPVLSITPTGEFCGNDDTSYAACTGSFSELGAGVYQYLPVTGEIDIVGMTSFLFSGTGAVDVYEDVQVVPAGVVLADAAAHGGSSASLTLSTLTVNDGASISNAGGVGLMIQGGSGSAGCMVYAGADAHALVLNSGSNGAGPYAGLYCASNKGNGVLVEGGASTGDHGMVIRANTGSSGTALKLLGEAGGSGLDVEAGESGTGMTITGGILGIDGLRITGGLTGDGLHVAALATSDRYGVFVEGDGDGEGLFVQGGATGTGATISAGVSGNGHGLALGGGGTGAGFNIAGNIAVEASVVIAGDFEAAANKLPWNDDWDSEVGGESSDWTTEEKQQIRYRLGLDGDTDAPSATPALPVTVADKTGFELSGTLSTFDAFETALNSTHGSGSWATASGFSTHSASDVWSVGTRVLTAGTNIALEKGTGVTGFNDLSAAEVNAEADAALSDVGLTTTITGRIDAAVSSRLASAGYTSPDNSAITAIKAKTDNLPSSPAAVGSAMTLADGAITDAKFTVPALSGPATGPVGYLYQLWRRFFKKAVYNAGDNQLKTFANDGSTVITTQVLTDSSGVQTQGPAT